MSHQVGETVRIMDGTKVANCFIGGRQGKVLAIADAGGKEMLLLSLSPTVSMPVPASLVEVVKAVK